MSDPGTVRSLLDAVAFSARAHKDQQRKDGRTPYASHPFRVCLIVRHVFGFDDPRMLLAALLHDTIEDTTTDYDDLEKQFGADVAGWVACLSKDKRLPEKEREQAYLDGLCSAPWQVQVCKLADMFDNLQDAASLPVEKRKHTLKRIRQYLQALRTTMSQALAEPLALVEAQLQAVPLD